MNRLHHTGRGAVFRAFRVPATALLLVGCASAPTTQPVQPPEPPSCVALKIWSDVQQDEMRKEYDALAPSAILREAFMDYMNLRDDIRAGGLACPAAATPPPSANTLY